MASKSNTSCCNSDSIVIHSQADESCILAYTYFPPSRSRLRRWSASTTHEQGAGFFEQENNMKLARERSDIPQYMHTHYRY